MGRYPLRRDRPAPFERAADRDPEALERDPEALGRDPEGLRRGAGGQLRPLTARRAARDAANRAGGRETDRLGRLRERALTRGVNPVLYRIARIVLLPSFLVYFRLERIGSEHLPRSGPLLLAANHRSFLDPFVIGSLTRRPVYYMAKRELFGRFWQARLLNALGAFPIDRGRSDEDAIATARKILQRGDCVVIFPEGTRVRPGPLGAPRRGIGRLALETGAPVVPVAVNGTEDIRHGWWIRPRKVRIRCGAPLGFKIAERPTPALSAAVTERIWACVNLQWEWLGGAPAARREPVGTRDHGSDRACDHGDRACDCEADRARDRGADRANRGARAA